jgi:hypothetical protein
MAIIHKILGPDVCNLVARYFKNIFYMKCYVYINNYKHGSGTSDVIAQI